MSQFGFARYLQPFGGAVLDYASLASAAGSIGDALGKVPASAYIAGAGALASGIGAMNSSDAATQAAQVQAAAAGKASDQSLQQYYQTRNDLAPYRAIGGNAGNTLSGSLNDLAKPFNPDMSTLENTPGYQFALNQGLQGVQNSASARGLGISGAAMKGAADYAQGLASKTYNDQFNIDQTNKQNSFNKLLQVTGIGQNAANQTGAMGQAATQNANTFATTGAAATAAGDVGSANAITSGLNGASNNIMNGYFTNRLLDNQANNPNSTVSAPMTNPYGPRNPNSSGY